MKANKKMTMYCDDSAQMGIGTLIIFIAMVLVAAVAAAVLIQTSGVLQQRATETGKEATAEVSSNIGVETVIGERTAASSANLQWINITVKVMAGAGDIDISQMRVAIQNETSRVENLQLNTTDAATWSLVADATHFAVNEHRDADDSYNPTNSNFVINSGDLMEVAVNVTAASVNVPAREPLRIELIPEHGASVIKELTMPASYGVDIFLPIFP
ncbi:MAG: archaellin/type IV pilin N-terminal domain-containing protein [Halobacteriota archaeon]|nr:archaellin/type IV pilin N-terminal domain-containing protein [Halobacteriota archaeon]